VLRDRRGVERAVREAGGVVFLAARAKYTAPGRGDIDVFLCGGALQ
jgi:hypothetical protein